ncbi:MAG: hypothetical protein A3C93_06355 [Candidatus Lloydbacteria bacterium RIFCSPHIGHO2_02_FULL_54_17]|uniref:Uncharacterized protein n=1 Tax=Candidatus Lloydbacteria bacterium RIFCSPHIGHO2_02_FULL_54_17 TaxID=1798664 RepID=A0A1G2DGG0_9BACT|nr:MAG: hypothetical protein A2762_01320 [Candidatus Lloydbacteria bacterium RIFCSPHIGHO2_01_FULL_54_11]OGZ12699.1 MAG: hypothetical protein A3C93_06355 [Candidatus Lloydbacteria bacterium RIFCSPHIGHO2_02_FULL_54_17]OGZ13551.1 MAG: hypothetical protein A2948_05020 [Candidatus Lloydbacteria bacterium RIFCSPLOWO2_01_FULL_54_18]OGZ16220.1 MAG: hypothetical protein A3H76_03850 [Candidatus Lloydbacteria bacterium RIFCSPLOWO2_02_FULL_54_12]
MLKKVLSLSVLAVVFACVGVANAGGSSNNDGGDRGAAYASDLIFTIHTGSIAYRADGHMMVCIDKRDNVVTQCRSAKDQVTLDDFWRWYFPQAPKLRVVAMDYRTYYSTYIFWLKR